MMNLADLKRKLSLKGKIPKSTLTLIIAIVSTISFVLILNITSLILGYFLSRPPDLPKVTYDEFIKLTLTKDALEKPIILREQNFFPGSGGKTAIFTIKKTQQKSWTFFDYTPGPGIAPEEYLRQLEFNVEIDRPFPLGYLSYDSLRILSTSLSGILMMGLFIWFITNTGMTKQALEDMGTIRTSRKMAGPKVTLDDVAGIEPQKRQIKELITLIKATDKLKAVRAQPPRGIFLYGPPGTGKTLTARAIIHETGFPFFWVSGADFGSPLIGLSTQKVDVLFEEAFRAAPSILVIDEMDSAAPPRAGLSMFESKEKVSLVNKLLSVMDRIEKERIPVYVIGITNFLEGIDPAILREGRFDEKIEIPLPMTIEARKAILEVHINRPEKKPLAPDVNLELVAAQTLGFSGAFLATLVNKAALRAAVHGRENITQEDFAESIELVIMGPIRDLNLTEKDLKITSDHEAGHTLVSALLPSLDPPQIVSLFPRGKALGFTWAPAKKEHFLQSKERLESLIQSALAGYVVEKNLHEQITTGSRSDLERANLIAHAMVFEYGMSELGPVYYEQQKNPWAQSVIASEGEKEIIRIVNDCEKKVTELLIRNPENKEKLARLSAKLLEKKRLDYDGIMQSIK